MYGILIALRFREIISIRILKSTFSVLRNFCLSMGFLIFAEENGIFQNSRWRVLYAFSTFMCVAKFGLFEDTLIYFIGLWERVGEWWNKPTAGTTKSLDNNSRTILPLKTENNSERLNLTSLKFLQISVTCSVTHKYVWNDVRSFGKAAILQKAEFFW